MAPDYPVHGPPQFTVFEIFEVKFTVFEISEVKYLKNGASYGQSYYKTLTKPYPVYRMVPISMTLIGA